MRASIVLLLVLVSGCTRDEPTTPNQPADPGSVAAAATDPVILAAGDLVCGSGTAAGTPCKYAATAALVGPIAPAAVLLLGDIQYENGTLADFNTYYGPTWGAYKSITHPAAGNHEYNTAGAVGYYDYFNGIGVATGPAGDRSKGYYSYDIGAWHLIALNSNCAPIGGCNAGSAQEQWLRADLAASTAACTIAYWHHPRFSSGSSGNNSFMQDIWQALYDYHADLVLQGHDHDFERFAPQSATGVLDTAGGVRSFVVGTGGKEKNGFATIRANSQVRAGSYGVLQLTLHPTSYDWQFVHIPGETLADAGSAACVTSQAPPPPPPPPPPTQTTLTIPVSADAYVFRNSPTRNFGSAATLLVDASPAARTYLKFPVTGIGTKTVVSARLRLYAVDPSSSGGRLHRVSSTSWGESTLRWSNAPSYTSSVIGSIGTVVVNTWYEIDVKSQISSDGTYSFALESASTNGADYRSRESGSAWRPQLVIVVQ